MMKTVDHRHLRRRQSGRQKPNPDDRHRESRPAPRDRQEKLQPLLPAGFPSETFRPGLPAQQLQRNCDVASLCDHRLDDCPDPAATLQLPDKLGHDLGQGSGRQAAAVWDEPYGSAILVTP